MWRILIVEDSPTNMMLTVEILRCEGHLLLQAENASKGIEIARQELPDVILMDIQLPDMDGLQATGLLKADPATAHIPIVALTAFAMKDDEQRILAGGCDGYIQKPVRYKEFLEALGSIMRQRGGAGPRGEESK